MDRTKRKPRQKKGEDLQQVTVNENADKPESGASVSEPSTIFQYHFTGVIKEDTFTAFSLFLRRASIELPKDGELEVLISSVGGSFNYCMAAFDMIRHMSQRVTTIIAGNADSCATVLFLAGDRRLVMPEATATFHEPSMKKPAEEDINVSESARMAKDLKDSFKKLLKIICKRTGIERLVLKKFCEDITTLSAKKLVKYGFAHKVLRPKKP